MLKFSNRHLAAAVAGALATATLVSAPVATAQSGGPATESVTLLNITDFHGRISESGPSTVAFADTVETLRAEAGGADKSLLLSAGDSLGASLFASSFKDDQPTIDVLNALGLASSAVGNHEFDKGIDDLQNRIIPAANWDHLGANVTVDGEPMQEYSIHEVSGLTVGVIGVVTRETPSLVSPEGIEGVEFSDPVEAVNRVAAQLEDGDDDNGEADIIVAEYHAGAPAADSIEVARAQSETFDDIVGNTSGAVDAIFTGHTHNASAWEGERPGAEATGEVGSVEQAAGSLGPILGGSLGQISGSVGSDEQSATATRPVLQAGSYGEYVGRVTLEVDPETGDVIGFTQANVEVPGDATDVDQSNPVVSEVEDIVGATLDEAEVVGGEPVGTVNGDITTAHLDGVRDDRFSESTLGNLVGQFLKEAVADRGGADIGFTNPGGLRDELLNDPAGEAGNITLAEANGVLPFANTLVTQDLTGEQIITILEQQWQPADAERAFLALGASENLTWTFDPTAATGEHITSVTLDGAPIDPSATYRVAAPSFLAGGGDNFTEFANGTDVRDTGLIDSESWQAYLSEHSDAGIDPDFARRAVAVKDLPSTVEAGEEYTFTVSDLNLTSLGVPEAQNVEVTLGDDLLGTFDAVAGVDNETFGASPHPSALDGHVDITVTIPEDATGGETALEVTTDTGTVVTIPVTVGVPVAPQVG